MSGDDNWNDFLTDHPIFAPAKTTSSLSKANDVSLELSLNTLPEFTTEELTADGLTPTGRRQVMVIKDSELILAVGKEIRLASLAEAKLSGSGGAGPSKTYKVLNTPNVAFDIHQMALNPNGKFLAVAGAYHVAVIVLPRPSYTRLVSEVIDCKSVLIGQYYHALQEAPIAKVDWHPWGDGGTTLLVMTVDGKLREYDIAVDVEEPQQELSFVDEKKSQTYLAVDQTEREVASFSLGKGKADWGPLSIYAIMKSGDIYAICPYMPKNTLVPSSYVHALECFVAAKQEFLQADFANAASSSSGRSLATVYDYQHKYVTALLKQLPPGTTFPSASRSVLMHPPPTIRGQPIRQGPFLLQPSPRSIEGSEGGDATDIIYLTFGNDADANSDSDGETERLGVMLVAFQDGKVDLYLDVEKVEARWERKHGNNNSELPMLAVYESIDLGIVATLSKLTSRKEEPRVLDLIHGNHPVLLQDPINDETIYVYHAFGVHAIQLGSLLQKLALALRDDISNDGEDTLTSALETLGGSTVHPMLSTFSIERRCSNPVIAVAIPSDVYLTYSVFILTSAMRVLSFPLTLQSENQLTLDTEEGPSDLAVSLSQPPSNDPPAYVSLLTEPYNPPTHLSRSSGLPSNPTLAVPMKGEIQLTPDTLRYLASTVERFSDQLREMQIAYRDGEFRAQLHEYEFKRQQEKSKELLAEIETFRTRRQDETRRKLAAVQEQQKELLARTDRILRAMMKSASPDLSEHEKKWFEELKRLQREIKGVKKYDQESLTARTSMLRKEFDRLLPNLKDLREKERRLHKRMSDAGKVGLGVTQAFEFGERSSKERAKISKIESDIHKLAEKLELTLGRPPSAEENTES